MKGLKENYLLEVLQHIRSKEAKEFVHRELNYHLSKSKANFVSKGIPETEAEEKAVKQMGSPSDLGRQFNQLHRPKIDWILAGLFILAFAMGLLPQINAQGYFAENVFLKQAFFIIIGVGLAVAVMLLDYRKLEKYFWVFLGISLFIQLSLLIFPNTFINGDPYIRFMGFTMSAMTVLPFLFLFWAAYLSKDKPKWLVVAGVYLLTTLLFLTMSGFAELMIYTVLVLVLFWRSEINRRSVYITIAGSFVLCSISFLLFWYTTWDYRKFRIMGFLHPENHPQDTGYMYLKIKDMIAGAGWLGNAAEPKYIPDLTTDLAFVNVTYYYGWIVAGVLILVLSLLLSRMIFVVMKVKDRFGKQLVTGVSALLMIQCVYNIGMTLGFFPIISLSLPFISYGLTPAVLNSFIIGIALSVYRRKDLTSLGK